MCPCRGGRGWEGGGGRVQAERPTRTHPQGQGNGPEGERHTELDRSPCPGRRCPCGCPQQVDRLGHPLARGVARMAPGWLPTIMAGPAQPCPQRDETHHGSPQTWLVASRRTDRALYPETSLDLIPGDRAVLGDLSSGVVGGLNVRQVLRRLGEPLQVIRVDHRGHTTAPAGQEDRLMSGADVVDNLIELATRNRDRQIEHDPSMGEGRSFHASSPRSDSGLLLCLPLAAVASDLRDHSRNNDDPHDVAPAPADTTPVHHSPPSTPPPITTTLQL